jgi:methionyl-tRNA formyltransferase
MRLVFMGTSAFAVPSLEALVAGSHDVAGTVTQPDRPRGRGQRTQGSPVGIAARTLGLDLLQPETLDADEFGEWIRLRAPAAVVVVAYGKRIPPWLLTLPSHGAVNLHASLLPLYRGAAPVNWAIARGESRTGVCTMQMDEGIDTGPVYACREEAIGRQDTAPEVSERLARIGAELLAETLGEMEAGRARPRPQPGAWTRAPRLRREDGYVRWEWSALDIHNRIRGFLPWPGVVVDFRGERCQLIASLAGGTPPSSGGAPGDLRWESGHLHVRCGDGWLEILRLRLENRKAVSAQEFVNGFRLTPGDRMASFAPVSATGEP